MRISESDSLHLHERINRFPIMLGIKTRRTPIQGNIAKEIRNAAARVATGQLNEREKANAKRAKEVLSQYDIKWEL